MATPPFLPNESVPAASDLISAYPAVEQTFRDVIESWLLFEHNTGGTHKQTTLDDLTAAVPAGTASKVTVWNDAGALQMRDGTGTVTDILVGVADAVVTSYITDKNVTLAKLVDIATASFLGRTTAATGVPEVLTATQATAMLNLFSATLQGLVPLSGGGTANFLRADATWAAPPSYTKYDSGVVDWTTTNHNVAHGLGAQPDFFQVTLQCIVNNNGFIVGDEVILDRNKDGNFVNSTSMTANATNLYFSHSGSLSFGANRGGGGDVSFSNTQWSLRFRAVVFA